MNYLREDFRKNLFTYDIWRSYIRTRKKFEKLLHLTLTRIVNSVRALLLQPKPPPSPSPPLPPLHSPVQSLQILRKLFKVCLIVFFYNTVVLWCASFRGFCRFPVCISLMNRRSKKNDQPKLFLFRLIKFWSTCPAELIF